MKKKHLFAITLLLLSLSLKVNAQSISVTKVFHYLEIQNKNEIEEDLLKLGFKFNKKRSEVNLTEYSYHKTDSYGLQKVSIFNNDELFSIIYNPVTSFYLSLKEIMLKNEKFNYAYTNRDIKFYESNDMRIGINDKNETVSFFVKLKEQNHE